MITMICGLLALQVALLVLIALVARETRFAVHLISQQLEYLGAPLELTNGVLHAARKTER